MTLFPVHLNSLRNDAGARLHVATPVLYALCWCRCPGCKGNDLPTLAVSPLPPRIGSFHFGFHYAVYFHYVQISIGSRLAHVLLFQLWIMVKFGKQLLQISTPPTMSPERFAIHNFHYYLDHATSIIDKAFTLVQTEGSQSEYDMNAFRNSCMKIQLVDFTLHAIFSM